MSRLVLVRSYVDASPDALDNGAYLRSNLDLLAESARAERSRAETLRAICYSCKANPAVSNGLCAGCQRAANARALRMAQSAIVADGPARDELACWDPSDEEYYFAPGILNERRGSHGGGE